MEIPQSIVNLRKVINNRAVAILLPGTSISELEARIDELKDLDLCYASVNDFWVMEQCILSKISKRLDLILCAAVECEFPSPIHLNFLRRKDENMILTELSNYHHTHMPLHEFMVEFKDKVFPFTADYSSNCINVPSLDHPLSFMALASFIILIQLCIIGNARSIVLFGADGGRIEGGKLYYEGWKSDSEQRLNHDTFIINQFLGNLLNNIYQTYQLPGINIYNSSLKSHYETFLKVTYDEAFSILKGRIPDNK